MSHSFTADITAFFGDPASQLISNMANGRPVEGSIYIYAPNKIGPFIFAALFFISGAVHLWQCIHYRSFKITALHPFCCLLFTVGFALRAWGAFDFSNLNVYIASQMFIMCAPPLLELANYHTLGRVLYYAPYFTPMHPGRVLTTFGFLSGVVEVMNAIGVSYIAQKNAKESIQDLGHVLMKVSLILQVVVIMSFCMIAGVFWRRCARAGLGKVAGIRAPLTTLYASMALILVRCIYRIVEHFTITDIPKKAEPGYDPMRISPILRWEWYFYVFEAALMLSNTTLWNARHPRRYLPEKYTVYLAQDGKTELEGPGWKNNKPWLMTFIDPFDWFGKHDDKQDKQFWEMNGFENEPLVKRQQNAV
ncbi:hypothetical protein B0J11DRAFT_181772 [Dendryphion nanum]|uniref:RTA1 domain protein n=1 Tax=Dendryphion nanum TaxID=256645 RepID=A0A9P9D5A6_9PLEO|nr:hypothetical protein B0J11DRAFT_181772 [Dendryphion nanum]